MQAASPTASTYLSIAAEPGSSLDACKDAHARRARLESRYLRWSILLILFVLVVVNMATLIAVVKSSASKDKELKHMEDLIENNAFPYHLRFECMYASSGGQVRDTGGFPQTKLDSDNNYCTQMFDWYFQKGSGQYWRDLERLRDEAIAYYTTGSSFPANDSSILLVFDIDETVLSNLAWIRDPELKRLHAQKMAQGLKPSKPGASTGSEELLPPLEAMRDVYLTAYKYGMSVAFITGRSESGRHGTETNLASVGYGRKCPTGPDGKPQRTTGEPCYVALHLRDEEKDMHKLASVYKPERRKKLVDAGYDLVGTFGDQYSDLEGLHPATASWKAPNPLYYIL